MRLKQFAPILLALLFACTSPDRPSDAASKPDSDLENTYWKLTAVRGESVAAVENQQEAHLVLHPEEHRLAGSGGCNRLAGGYRLEGAILAFTQVAATRMACVSGMDTELEYLAALDEVRRWEVTGERLGLYDAAGTHLLQFEAVYLP